MIDGTIHQPTKILNEAQLELAETSRIDSFCLINAEGGIRIKDQSVIHAGTHIVGSGGLEMGPRAVVTYNCVLLTSTADLGYPASSVVPKEQRRDITADIRLEHESFVGSGSVVMPGVTVGEGGVIAANAYVAEDVPPWSIRFPDGSTCKREQLSERFPD